MIIINYKLYNLLSNNNFLDDNSLLYYHIDPNPSL